MFLPQRVAIQNFMEIQLRPNKLPNYGCLGFTCLIIMLDIWMFHPYIFHVYYVKFISILCLYMLPFFGWLHIDCSIHDIQRLSRASFFIPRYFFHHDDDYVSLAHSNMNVDNAAWQKQKKNMTEDMLKGCHFLINQPSGPHADPDLRCPERWRIWVRFHRSELAGHPGILKLSDFTRNPVLRLLQPPKHGDFSRTIQAPRFLWNEAIPLYPIVYDHLNPAMGQTQNRRSLP